MKRNAYAGTAGVFGGGSGEVGLGEIHYFGPSELVTNKYARCDGGGQFQVSPGLIAKGVFTPGAWRKMMYGTTTNWYGAPSSNYNFKPEGRSLTMVGEIIVHWAWNATQIVAYGYSNSVSPNNLSTASGWGQWGLIGGLDAQGLCNGNMLVFSTGLKLLVSTDPGPGGANYTTYTIAQRNSLNPVYFKGLYVSGQGTAIRTCDGVAWATWNNATTVGTRTGDFMDLVTDGETLVAFTNAGEIFTSTDGVTFTKITTVGIPAFTYTKMVNDGAGTWAISKISGGGKVFTSTDLVNWTDRGNPVSSDGNVLSGGGGMFFVIKQGVSGAIAGLSSDGGQTWEVVAQPVTPDWPGTAFIPITGGFDGGNYIILGSDGSYSAIHLGVAGSRRPNLPYLTKSGQTFTPHMRVK